MDHRQSRRLLFVRRGAYATTELFTPSGIYGAWGANGLIAYALGFASTIPFFVWPGFYTGRIAQAIGGIDVAGAVGLVVSSLVYLMRGRWFDRGSEHVAIARSESERALINA